MPNACTMELHDHSLRGNVRLLMDAARFGVVSDLDKHIALLRQHLRSFGHVACSQPALGADDNAEGFVAAKAGDGIDGNGVHDVGKERAGAVNVSG